MAASMSLRVLVAMALISQCIALHAPTRVCTNCPIADGARRPSAIAVGGSTLRLSMAEGETFDDDDDDGWGAGGNAESKELQMLQNDMAAKQSNQGPNSARSSGGEQDLFIPIFSLVSVIGFASLYGYEMLRLYSRGELYLPWEN